ncbi:hypothetical protein [Rhodopseudomonas pseudopalustris]|uniref:Uncharacterized protein n=1 Tax=Rhodopseudomonas pseudopalustris TaxID=1513892 RepID=A0A1H8QQR0_9BRAD|nr:hypothetical protein [Rhodopseudomonas pseudopalustris]SEO56555.1 hypothetical protein SAMN05444123_103320 [Rhodopseudomonas pseudopalustris]
MRTKLIRITTTNYPVSRLPPDLREDLDPTAIVAVIVEHEEVLPDWLEKDNAEKD